MNNRELLEQPFPQDAIKQRKGFHGGTLDYIEGHTVIKRLNDAFEGSWSFQVISHEVQGDEVIVLGKLKADGITKTQFGSSRVTRNAEGEIVSLGDDFKAASTDALKKTATLLGVGLHLYDSSKNNRKNGNTRGDNGRLTNAQLKAIYTIAHSQDMPNERIKQMCRERFDRTPDFLTKVQASQLIRDLNKRKEGPKA